MQPPDNDQTIAGPTARTPEPAAPSDETLVLGDAHAERDTARVPPELGMLGDYRLLSRLGEGGMGVVYRAVQPGANRIVALKVIQSAVSAAAGPAARKQAEERFRTEIQAAAQVEHENIVPVYDVGRFGDLMYFAMRLVEGRSLIDMVRDRPLENRKAAEYILGTARGVAEAHRRGILHRDLKPHNVMVDERTDRPLVADFGLAKLVDGEAQVTRTGEALGTPSYMPPEQISHAASVDQRGDVYSLGATLYHLLTGRPPFQAANPLGTIRQVLYDEPLPPQRLNSTVDRDLDTICLKCLQKEPARRYQSMSELADDLQRYLRGEPIVARPIGRAERIVRWARRNPLPAGLIGVAALLAAVALTAIIVGYRETSAALAESERNLGLARQAVDELYTEVSEIDLKDQPGLQPLKQKLLGRALGYYEKLLADRADNAELTAELAGIEFRVGTITEELKSAEEALPHFETAARIQDDLLHRSPADSALQEALSDSWNSIGRVQHRLQRPDAAAAAYSRARQLREALAEAQPHNREYRRKLANVVMNIGLLNVRLGRLDDAALHYDAAQSMRRELLASGEEEPMARDFARGAFNLGTLALDRGELDVAARNFETAVTWFGRLADAHPESLSYRFELAVAAVMRGDALQLLDQPDAALIAQEYGIRTLRDLVRENPQVLAYQHELGRALIGAGQLQLRLALDAATRDPAADAADPGLSAPIAARVNAPLLEALNLLERLQQQDPDAVETRFHQSVVLQLLGEVGRLQGDDAIARQRWQSGLDVLAPLQTTFDRHPECAQQWSLLQQLLQELPVTAAP